MKFRLAAFADEAGSSIAEQISAMKENGVEYLEIRGVNGENIADLTNEKARGVRRQLMLRDYLCGRWDRPTERSG